VIKSTSKNPLWRLLALLLAMTLVMAACGGDDDEEAVDTGDEAAEGDNGGGGGGVECENIAIGFFGALTGPNAGLGINELNGAQIAIDEFNKENKDCQVELKKFDSQGSPDQAPALAQQVVGDKEVVGLIGPAFSGESRVANPIFDQAGVTVITASATGVDLSTKGWKTFHRAVGNDNAQGPAIVEYLKTKLNAKKVAVLDDKSEYGKGLADIVRKELGALATVSDSFDDKTTEFSSTVNKIKAAGVDAVVFGGYYSQGGPLAKQLKEGGVTAQFIGPDGVNDPGFVTGAGTAAEGAILTAPSAPAEVVDGADEFAAEYKKRFNEEVGLYALEAYDAAKMYLKCIEDGNTTREKIETCIDGINYEGLTKTYKFASNGELDGKVTVYAYKVEGGKIKGLEAIGG
jgi:branched-chain amino acid transport system substrate-binding protein